MEAITVEQVDVEVRKYNKTESLVFVNGIYKGMIRKFPNTKTDKHPFTATVATNGAGSMHELAGHFYPADGGKDAAIMAIVHA